MGLNAPVFHFLKRYDNMKKITVVLILIIAMVAVSFAATGIAGDSRLTSPTNIIAKKLGTCNGSSADTIAASGANVYGPYSISVDNSRGMFTGIQLIAAESCIANADSLRFDYQLIYGDAIGDTVASGWTTVDTIANNSGKIGTYTSLSSAAANAILFRLYNIDADPAGIVAPIRVLFKSGLPDTK